MSLEIETKLSVRASGYVYPVATITIQKDGIYVSMLELTGTPDAICEMKLLAALAGIRKARWLYRRTYGKPAP